jgi:tricorn protease
LIYDVPVTSTGYLRYPNAHGDLLAFVAEEDIWLAPVSGGRAWRVSADQSGAADPRISPDGRLVTWTSWRDGCPEVYLASTEGGGTDRVSYWSDSSTEVRGWSPAGEIMATTAAGQPFGHHTWAYAIPVTDGTATFSGHRRLPFGPVVDLAADSVAVALLTGTTGREPAYWKRYRGGMSGRLWLASTGIARTGHDDGGWWGAADGQQPGGEPLFRRLLADLAGQISSPMLVSGRMAFLCDHEGTGNVYSCALDGTDLRRHTDHDGFYARNASTDGTRVVYHCAGDIWLLADLDPASEPVRIEVTLSSPAAGRAPRLISAQEHLADLSCDLTGQASAVEVRGTVHWLTHKDGPARALSVIGGAQARLPRVLGSTGQVIWVTDADGADALEIAAAEGPGSLAGERPRRIAAGAIGWVADLAAAPNGKMAAVAARDGRLLAVDIGTAEVAELARSDNGPVTGLAWAPDSAWLAWAQPGPDPRRRLRMARLADRQVVDVTDHRFIDSDPVFTTDGRYLAFLSRRNFDPVYDAHFFDLAFPYGSRPYLIPLAAATPSPFGPLPDGRPLGGAKDKEAEDKEPQDKQSGETATGETATEETATGEAATEEAATEDGACTTAKDGDGLTAGGSDPVTDSDTDADQPEPVVIDLDGLATRIVQVPVPESRYECLRAVDGGLAWLREPLAGKLGEGGANLDDDHPRPTLEYFDLKRARCIELEDEVDWFEASGDGTRLVVMDRPGLFVIPANRKADADSSDDHVSVDLSRARYLADPVALWRAAFAEAGRVMRHEFWVPDMADVDWDGALEAYRPLLDRIATASDFADLLLEVFGELGSSHAYVFPAAGSYGTGHTVALLGADLQPVASGWQVSRILPGESSDPRARSPLAAPGTAVQVGDLLLAVDGQPVDPATGPGPLLVGAAGKPVELTVAATADGTRRRAVVIPLANERRLRYQDWVAERRRIVRELSGGRIGYLHVPDMVAEGWSDFHRDLRGEMLSDALIIDVRANRGGHTSQLVIEKLSRRIVGWDVPRGLLPLSYPVDAPRGPVVAIADEFAGSDGDIVTAAIRTLGLGPVVGTRTWGGVIGIYGSHRLVDGTRMTAPKTAVWFNQFGWEVENYGVEPDVEVLNSPDDWASGTDQQLLTATAIALEALEQRPPVTAPSTADRPSRRRPPLPPRQPAS